MVKRKYQIYLIIFIILFFVFNIFNTYFLTSQLLNRYISPIKRTFKGELTSFLGNFSVLLLIVLFTIVIFKKDKNRMRFLLYTTLFLNIFILLSGYFTYFYSTVFTVRSLDIFKNPSEGVSDGLFTLAVIELFKYYRIVVLLPFVILLIVFIKYKKKVKNIEDINSVSFGIKRILIMSLTLVLTSFIFNLSYLGQINEKDSFNIKSLSGTRGVQNYGVYPYYITELLGIELEGTTKKSLNIETEQQLFDAYNEYNKNQSSYINFIDGELYSNNLLVKDSVATVLGLNDTDSLTGIFANKDLVLVHLESLNYLLWEIPEIRERFTFLNKLFEESFIFDNYYTSVGMGVSSDAEASVLTGLYMNGYSTLYRDYQNKNYDFDTLPKLFNNFNYRSMSIHNDNKVFYNRDKAYKELLGFTEDYFSLEDFALRDGYTNLKEYNKARLNGFDYNGLTIKSPWPSEFEVNDVLYEQKAMLNTNSFIFPVYLTPHTPFLFNPYQDQQYDFYNYDKLSGITKRYVEYVKYNDELLESTFFDPKTKESRIDTNTVYIFYSDHGSSLKNGDLSILYNDSNMSLLRERQILQQTIAFIYAPSEEINNDGINKGIIKGNQKLVRSHIDLYRTIGDLFNLFEKDNPYFGVHGLSKEPTFVFDNRIQDVIIDDIEKINNFKYRPFLVSFRNENYVEPNNREIKNQNRVYREIKQFKRLSDLLLKDDTVYKDFKKALQK